VLESPMLSGPKDIIDVISGPGDAGDKVAKFGGTAIGSFMPSGIAAIARGMDPIRDRQTDGFLDPLKGRTPGFREDLAPRVGPFGEVEAGRGLAEALDPFRSRATRDDDPVVAELLRRHLLPPGTQKAPGESKADFAEWRRSIGPAEKQMLGGVKNAAGGDSIMGLLWPKTEQGKDTTYTDDYIRNEITRARTEWNKQRKAAGR
jgi:hypothetical protein